MSDNEDDYHIESADAGASAVIPMEAGQIKKGGCVRTYDLRIVCVSNLDSDARLPMLRVLSYDPARSFD